jgi:cysteine desulfuration protein SufE
MSIETKLAALRADFANLPDDEERLRLLIQRGRRALPLAFSEKNDARLLPGCISSLWLIPGYTDGVCRFRFDADAQVVRGVAALVCGLYDGETPATIVACPRDFLNDLGIGRFLTSNRSNSLNLLEERIHVFAELQLYAP